MDCIYPHPISPKELQCWLEGKKPHPTIIDVREDTELSIAPFPFKVLHLPLSRSNAWLSELPTQLVDCQNVVVICHAGIRSRNFGIWLLEQKWGFKVWNLEGGVDEWSLEVDPKLQRY